MTAYINHITLTTGHIVRVPRSAMTEADIEAATDLLDSILTGGKPTIAPGYVAFGAHSGKCLLVTVCAADGLLPILTTGVAIKSRPAARLWREMHGGGGLPLATKTADPPQTPWCADRIEVGATEAQHHAALSWTGRWAATLAWAWLGYDRGGADK